MEVATEVATVVVMEAMVRGLLMLTLRPGVVTEVAMEVATGEATEVAMGEAVGDTEVASLQ